jgi:hypothetical protein
MRTCARRSPLLVALLILATSPGICAGDYHDGTSLVCTESHVVHVAGPVGDGAAWDRAADAGRLLKKDINELCLSCHDDSTRATDVLGLNAGRDPQSVRQAGYLSLLGQTGLEATGHTLGSVEMAPGSDPPWNAELENGASGGLNCINCHKAHGNGNPFGLIYRSGEGTLTEDGGSRGESHNDLCGQCHSWQNTPLVP